MQAPAAPPGDQARNYYPFLDFAWANCIVKVALGPTHWSDYSSVHHGVLELVCTHPRALLLTLPLSPLLAACCRGRIAVISRYCPKLGIVQG